jgi:hypothetical protein
MTYLALATISQPNCNNNLHYIFLFRQNNVCLERLAAKAKHCNIPEFHPSTQWNLRGADVAVLN